MAVGDTTSSQQIPLPPLPDARRVPCVLVIAGASLGRSFRLEQPELVIGRSGDADIRIEDEGVSRHHVRVCADENGIRVVDLGSTNGTLLNGLRIDEAVLKEGDKLQIGACTILKFHFQDALEEDMQRRLYESASRDSLTGVHNKRLFLETMEKDVAFARRHGMPLSVLMIDLDHFKQVNDNYGHLAGDEVLVKVAQTLQQETRMEDLLARYGGEEFAVLLRKCAYPDAMLAAERIRAAVENVAIEVEGQRVPLRISVGVATLSPDGDAEALIGAADEQLYRAKSSGRNRVCG